MTLNGFSALYPAGPITLDNVIVDNIGPSAVEAEFANIVLGPGAVNFSGYISGQDVTVTPAARRQQRRAHQLRLPHLAGAAAAARLVAMTASMTRSMNRPRRIALLVPCLLLAACTTTSEPRTAAAPSTDDHHRLQRDADGGAPRTWGSPATPAPGPRAPIRRLVRRRCSAGDDLRQPDSADRRRRARQPAELLLHQRRRPPAPTIRSPSAIRGRTPTSARTSTGPRATTRPSGAARACAGPNTSTTAARDTGLPSGCGEHDGLAGCVPGLVGWQCPITGTQHTSPRART